MNHTFEQLIGRQVYTIFKLQSGDSFPTLSTLIGLILMLDKTSGLAILFNFDNPTLNITNSTLDDFRYNYGVEYGETTLLELKKNEPLGEIIGQKIKAIKIGQPTKDKFVGKDFIVKTDEYTGILIELENDKLTIFATESGERIITNREQEFPNYQDWI